MIFLVTTSPKVVYWLHVYNSFNFMSYIFVYMIYWRSSISPRPRAGEYRTSGRFDIYLIPEEPPPPQGQSIDCMVRLIKQIMHSFG